MASGVGPWDKWVINWLYGARTDAEARRRSAQARAEGLRFVADNDRAAGRARAIPKARLWDDGADPGRRAAAHDGGAPGRARSGSDTRRIPAGESLADLRRAFVPIWLLDRYQVEAAAKSRRRRRISPMRVNGEHGGRAAGAGRRRNGRRFTRCSTRCLRPS